MLARLGSPFILFPGKSAAMFQTHLDCSIIRFISKVYDPSKSCARWVKNVLMLKTTQL